MSLSRAMVIALLFGVLFMAFLSSVSFLTCIVFSEEISLESFVANI